MGEFLSGPDLSEAIREILRQRPLCCAVAYWGPRARDYFGAGADLTGVRIVCDLGANGTDPNTIAALMAAGAEVRANSSLHAKVYLGGGKAIVASANLSEAALNRHGDGGWLEAGVCQNNPSEVKDWFDWLYNISSEVDPRQIRNELARRKQDSSPHQRSLLSFGQYECAPDFPKCPLFCWFDEKDEEDEENDETDAPFPKVNVAAVQTRFGTCTRELARRFKKESLPFNDFHNASQFERGSILWVVKRDGEINEKDFYFSHHLVECGIIPDAIIFNDEWTGVLPFVVNRGLDPWDAADPIFRAALLKVLETDEFKPLISDYDGPWGTVERLALVKKLWPAVQKEYLRPTA